MASTFRGDELGFQVAVSGPRGERRGGGHGALREGGTERRGRCCIGLDEARAGVGVGVQAA